MRQSLLALVVALWLVACAAPERAAPISTLPQPPSQRLQHHWVAAGETLYAIAWRYGLDYRELARINGLREPYRLQRNAKLWLSAAAAPATATGHTSAAKAALPTPAVLAERVYNQHWQWPASGRVEQGFSPAEHHQGLSLAGAPGRAVKPAAAGVVVYAGAGLRGYGKLIIVKHNELLLSAYAHNAVLEVAEGGVVNAATVLAKAGDSGRVYFEIRRDGKPVDPLDFLPVR